eukprot:12099235-Alexandrium_andersonii.AAC.1
MGQARWAGCARQGKAKRRAGWQGSHALADGRAVWSGGGVMSGASRRAHHGVHWTGIQRWGESTAPSLAAGGGGSCLLYTSDAADDM